MNRIARTATVTLAVSLALLGGCAKPTPKAPGGTARPVPSVSMAPGKVGLKAACDQMGGLLISLVTTEKPTTDEVNSALTKLIVLMRKGDAKTQAVVDPLGKALSGYVKATTAKTDPSAAKAELTAAYDIAAKKCKAAGSKIFR